MKKKCFMSLVISCLFLCSCMTTKNHSVHADFRDENPCVEKIFVESDFDGMEYKALEEQAETIANALSSTIKTGKKISMKIKLYEKTFFSDADYVRALFLFCSLYDGRENCIAAVSEYKTGNETFLSPEVQEKFLRNCIAKINKLGL